jgi:phage protein D
MSRQARLSALGRPRIQVDGAANVRLEKDLIRLEVRADAAGVASLEAVFLNWGSRTLGDPVDFVHFDRADIDFGKRIRIAFEVTGAEEAVFEGLITGIGGAYPELRAPELTLLAEDALAGLRYGRRTRLSEEETDGDIARRILGDAGLSPDVSRDGSSHTALWQVNQDELSALRERTGDALIALRDGTVHVSEPVSAADPPIELTRENDLIRFTVLADLAHQRGEVRVHGWDVAAKEAIHESAGADAVRPEASGGRLGPEVVAQVFRNAAEDLHLEVPATGPEARTLAEAAMRRRARRFVRGVGLTKGTPALRVGSRVRLVDLGPWFAGTYLVTAVAHRFDQSEGYRTEFEAQRPDLGDGS